MRTFNNYNIIIMHYHKLILNNDEKLNFNDEDNEIMKKIKNKYV